MPKRSNTQAQRSHDRWTDKSN